MSKKIIFSSGGTGGHILPAINTMKYFANLGYDTLLVTDARGNNFLKNNIKFKSYIMNSDTLANKNFFKKILSLTFILFSIFKSIFIIARERPNLVFGFGGYVSFPISLASKFFNIPLVIYENNLVLGRANRYLLPISKKIFLGKSIPVNFPEKYTSKVHKVGYILSEEILNFVASEKIKNIKTFSILVLGGSQGAEIFGKIIPPAIKMIKEKGHEIEIHQQCIESQKELLIEFYNKNNIKNNIFSFKDNILNFISSSNLAITRCGASSIAELVQTLTPFIAIPLPHSMDNHQLLNAQYYKNKGCCWLIEEKNLNPKILFNLIIEIIKDKQKLENVRINMKKSDSKNVYVKIEKEIKEFF